EAVARVRVELEDPRPSAFIEPAVDGDAVPSEPPGDGTARRSRRPVDAAAKRHAALAPAETEVERGMQLAGRGDRGRREQRRAEGCRPPQPLHHRPPPPRGGPRNRARPPTPVIPAMRRIWSRLRSPRAMSIAEAATRRVAAGSRRSASWAAPSRGGAVTATRS